MKLIVGLGNPGPNYEKTRHNAGFMAIDRLASRHAPSAPARSRFNSLTFESRLDTAEGQESCLFMKPMTYMNRSGLAVADAVRFFKVNPTTDLFVIVDDLYIPCGSIRIRGDGGSGGHNGLADIERSLGTANYARCRVGIDQPTFAAGADYVLERFTEVQWAQVDPAITRAADAAEVWATKGLNAAMNKFNAPDAPPKPKREKPPAPPDPGSAGSGGAPAGSG
ncbi:MAG TPA: aminoacyl-tRNA hydrolase [Phycisphaerales bacterium]|nr:aminoacyl-tRNA hydrolase [Phycisphaerales bacterium]